MRLVLVGRYYLELVLTVTLILIVFDGLRFVFCLFARGVCFKLICYSEYLVYWLILGPMSAYRLVCDFS